VNRTLSLHHESAATAQLLSRIEDAGLNASAPSQQRLIDGWLLRFSPGKARRARCVNAVAAGRLPVADKLALCEAVYAEVGLPLIVRITPFSEPLGLDRSLADAGMRSVSETRVMMLPDLSRIVAPAMPRGVMPQRLGHEAFAQTVGQLRGSTLAQRQAHAQRLVHAPVPFSGQALKWGSEVAVCAQTAIERDLVGLYDIYTAPAHRNRGLARLLCEHLLAQARSQGARVAYLQVDRDNEPARALYRRLGFADAYSYHYRTRDLSAS
jgi:GNAT superfamily N-acetyltransferase